jgi:hypothetical protein
MSSDSGSDLPYEVFVQLAAATGLDTSDTERMADLQGRVQLMRTGIRSLYEIDVDDSESPSAFIPATE